MKRILYIKDWAMVVIFILVAPMVYGDNDITIENAEMRLVISEEGHAKSLIHKATGQECLAVQDSFPVFAVKQSDRLPSQEMLVHPAEPKFLPATKVRRMGNKLKISFRHLSHRVTVRLDITDSYIGFTVDNIKYNGSRLSERLVPPLDELIFLRLPVRERDHFGGWLNVMHDADVAVNVLATNQYPKVDGKPRCGYRIMEARAIDEVKTLGVSAALITTETKHLMDRIQQVEKDFNLPTGVKSRSCEEYKYSVYWPTDITPDNVDRHVQYAKAGGFKLFMISVNSFATVGHFSWNEEYSNGMEDFNK
ncbi:MAG: hypothetical protein KGY69_18865, partial [Bacteroidales bacterium]|nr:hypothetical protein [Bacteroidales bacterium]